MEQLIPWIQVGGTLLVVVLVLIQNRVLRTQITKQNEIINNMRAYADIIKMDNIKQYVEMREQTFKDVTEKEKDQSQKLLLDIVKHISGIVNDTRDENNQTLLGYGELIAFVVKYVSLNVLPKNHKVYVEKNFPKSAKYILHSIETFAGVDISAAPIGISFPDAK